MLPHQKGWQPKFGNKRFSGNNQKLSSFRPVKGNASTNVPRFFQRRQTHYVPAGMFACAKSSVPQTSRLQLENSLSNHPVISKSYSASPERATRILASPRAKLSKTWNFSDGSSKKDQPERTAQVILPALKKLDSEEEITAPRKEGIPTTSMTTKPEMPWLKKFNSDDEAATKTPRKVDKLDILPGLDKTLARFSARLDKPGAIPPIFLQNHTETTMGTVEKALLGVAIAQSNSDLAHKACPVFNLLVERSDWLLYREEFNDETDYPPRDPFYSHDIVSSEFEEYEQEKEAEYDPRYSKSSSGNERVQEDTEKDESFLKETDDLDSQEDFFKKGFPTTSEAYDWNETLNNNFSFDFSEKPSPEKRKSTKRPSRAFSDELFAPNEPSTSKKRICAENPFDNLPRIPTSSEFSPFNYSFLSQSPPSSPKGKSPKSSKYSFW